MSEFKEIKTQEEFDAAIAKRLEREQSKYEAEINSLKSEVSTLKNEKKNLEEQISSHANDSTTIEELNKKVSKYETDSVKMRIAHELGIPFEMASRLNGTNEEEIRKDAESISQLLGNQEYIPPLADGDTIHTEKDQAYKKLLKGLEGE